MKTKNELKKEWHKQCREKTLFCWLCGQLILKESEISADHVIPQSKGGTSIETNLQPAHSLCNSVRDVKDPEVFRNILQKEYNGDIHAWWNVIHKKHLEKIRK
jgi:5-methylcytosine-specific restriction endonuclease McrA